MSNFEVSGDKFLGGKSFKKARMNSKYQKAKEWTFRREVSKMPNMNTKVELIGLFIIGVWLLLSPWCLGFSSLSVVRWNSVFTGIAIILVTGWMGVNNK